MRPHFLPREVPSIIVAAVYNLPRSARENKLLDHLTHSITTLKAQYPNCGVLLCGDFNHVKVTSVCDREITNVVKQPMCGANTLDLILSNLACWYQSCTILLPVGSSDHASVLRQRRQRSAHSTPPATITYRHTPCVTLQSGLSDTGSHPTAGDQCLMPAACKKRQTPSTQSSVNNLTATFLSRR